MRQIYFWATLWCLAASGQVFAATEAEYEDPQNDVGDVASLQRGAGYFVNYCLGCHSAQYVRYSRLAEDLAIPDDQLAANLMFTTDQPFDTMVNAISAEDAERWFGVAPPDLTLMVRARGADYVYAFLRSFYASPGRSTGVDNSVLPGTAMPHVLWELQGTQAARFATDETGAEHLEQLVLQSPGALTTEEFDVFVRDLVNFMDYISEPMQLQRQALGLRVIAFLMLFLVLAYLLKREIWKDVQM